MCSYRLLCTAIVLAAVALFAGCGESPKATEPTSPNVADPSMALGNDDRLDPSAGGEPFSISEIYFEFNSTDNDLGVQVFLDGEDWKRLRIYNPMFKKILDIQTKREFGELGLTELRFESAEPSPGEVLALFSPGTYRFHGATVDGEPLAGEGTLSNDLAPAPVFTPGDGDIVDADDTVVEWDFIPGVESYEVIVVNEDTGLEFFAQVPGDVTSLKISENFMESDAEYKAEVLAILPNGNKTITETVFTTSP